MNVLRTTRNVVLSQNCVFNAPQKSSLFGVRLY